MSGVVFSIFTGKVELRLEGAAGRPVSVSEDGETS